MLPMREQTDHLGAGIVDAAKGGDVCLDLRLHVGTADAKIPTFQIRRAKFFRLEKIAQFLQEAFGSSGFFTEEEIRGNIIKAPIQMDCKMPLLKKHQERHMIGVDIMQS